MPKRQVGATSTSIWQQQTALRSHADASVTSSGGGASDAQPSAKATIARPRRTRSTIPHARCYARAMKTLAVAATLLACSNGESPLTNDAQIDGAPETA